MSEIQALELMRDLLYTALILALPALLVSLVVGLIVSILQTITSIQEQTLSFAPRLIAVALVLVLTVTWSAQMAVQFTVRMLEHASQVTR